MFRRFYLQWGHLCLGLTSFEDFMVLFSYEFGYILTVVLWHNLYTIKCTHFMWTTQGFLVNLHISAAITTIWLQNSCIIPKDPLCPLAVTHHLTPNARQTQSNSVDLLSWTFYINTTCGLLRLASFIRHHVFEVLFMLQHVLVFHYFFHCWVLFHSVDIAHFVYLCTSWSGIERF